MHGLHDDDATNPSLFPRWPALRWPRRPRGGRPGTAKLSSSAEQRPHNLTTCAGRRAQVGELARQNQALAAHLAEVEAHKGQLAAQVAALRERWQGAAAENLRLTSELAALRKTLQAHMGDAPLPAGEAGGGVAGELAGLPGLAAPPERAPSAPSPAEFFGNIAALTSGSYGGLPASSALADGPDLAGSLALDAPPGAPGAPLPGGGAPGAGGYGLPEPLAPPKAEAWRAFGRLGAASGGAPGGALGAGGGARPGGGHQEPSTPEYAEQANGGAARGPFGAVAGNAAGGQGLESWRPGGGAQGWRSLSGTGMGGSGGSGGGGHQQLLEDWRSISGPAAARSGPGQRRVRGAQLPPAPPAEEAPASAPPPRMTRTASPAVNTQRGARMAAGKHPFAVGRQAAALLVFGCVPGFRREASSHGVLYDSREEENKPCGSSECTDCISSHECGLMQPPEEP